MSESRLESYWDDIAPTLTPDEWHAACAMARQRETFHKVPLPAVLLAYATEYRAALKERRKGDTARAAAQDAARQIPQRTETTDALALENIAAIRRLLDHVGEHMAMPQSVRTAPEDLEYTPQEPDPAARNALLHAQARQVQAVEEERCVRCEAGERYAPGPGARFWHLPDDGRPI